MRDLGTKFERLLSAATFAQAGEHETARNMLRSGKSVVVTVLAGQEASPSLAYAIHAAARNNAQLDVLVMTSGEAGRGGLSAQDARLVVSAAVPVRVLPAKGPMQAAMLEQARGNKDILFFVVDGSALKVELAGMSEAAMRRFAEELGRPIVDVEDHRPDLNSQPGKEKAMASVSGRTKQVGKMLVMGLISIALYTYLLANQDEVNSIFGKGGWYAFLPIIVAFVFSFVHGSFTGDFWTVLGIEAARKKKEVK